MTCWASRSSSKRESFAGWAPCSPFGHGAVTLTVTRQGGGHLFAWKVRIVYTLIPLYRGYHYQAEFAHAPHTSRLQSTCRLQCNVKLFYSVRQGPAGRAPPRR